MSPNPIYTLQHFSTKYFGNRDSISKLISLKQISLRQKPLIEGRQTRGPRKGFEWPAQYFLKLSVPSILAEIEDRFDVKTSFFLFFSSFRDHYDFGTTSGKSETDFGREPFFFRDHYDFGTKSGKSETDFRRGLFF